MENQNNLYIAKEHLPREILGYELPHWLFPKQRYSLIQESDSIKVDRFDDIAGLVKFCLNQRGDEHFLDELHLDEFPEGYMGGKLSYLSDEEKVYLTFETFKEVGWLP